MKEKEEAEENKSIPNGGEKNGKMSEERRRSRNGGILFI